jgi:DNA primase
MSRGRISPEFLQKLKDSVNLIDVVGEHVVLRKSGSNFSGLCPFHNERSPSFSVSEAKQVYHCYGCKKGGDLLSFVQEIHGLSFVDAIEELAERASLPLPKDFKGGDEADPESAKRRNDQREKVATAHKLNRFAAKFFREQLLSAGKGGRNDCTHIAAYFRKRGVSEALSQAFYVGAAPASWDALANFFVNAKAPLPLAVELGLVKPSQKGAAKASGPGHFDLFRNRAMFPILDLRGKVVGFGGRGLPTPVGAPDVGGESPKYLNSSESLLFQKSKIAYGLFQAQKHIREKDEVILVEGYFDVLALHAAGFQNAVATCGTSLTEDHLAVFKKFCTQVTVLFDGDRAGITATDRAMELGLAKGLILFGASLPDGLDPDEILFHSETGEPLPEGVERMKTILASAAPLIDTRIESARQYSMKGTEERTKAVKQVGEWLAMYQDPVGRELRMEKVCQDFGISRSLLEQAMAAANPGARSVALNQRGGRGDSRPASPSSRVGGPTNSVSSAPRERKNVNRRAGGAQNPSPKEVILVRGLLRAGNFQLMLEESRGYFPPGMGIQDLAENPGVRAVLDAVMEKGVSPDSLLDSTTSSLGSQAIDGIDPKIRALLSEALVGADAPERAPFSEGEFRTAVQRGLRDAWARFSQELERRLRDAELKKDANLQAELAQEFLDVKRRMKEFASFYDEV